MEVENSLILEVPAEAILVTDTSTNRPTAEALLCDIKKEKEPLTSPLTNPDNLKAWTRLVTPDQSKISPGFTLTVSPLIQSQLVGPTLQPKPQLSVVGIQHLGTGTTSVTTARDRSQEEPVRCLEVSAHLVQTKEGPRLVLEGLRGLQLDQKQLEEIREVVVAQLYTVQVVARLEGRIPPSRVSLTIRGQFRREPPQHQNQQQHQQCLSSSQQQPRLFARLPQNVIQQGQFIHHEERGRVLLLPSNILRAYEARLSGETTIKVCSVSSVSSVTNNNLVLIGLSGDQIRDSHRRCQNGV